MNYAVVSFLSAGYYMYTEVSGRRHPGDAARLISPTIHLATGKSQCLTFYYSMYGDHIGTLSVSLKRPKIGAAIWKRSGTQGNAWRKAQVHLRGGTSFKVSKCFIWYSQTTESVIKLGQ